HQEFQDTDDQRRDAWPQQVLRRVRDLDRQQDRAQRPPVPGGLRVEELRDRIHRVLLQVPAGRPGGGTFGTVPAPPDAVPAAGRATTRGAPVTWVAIASRVISAMPAMDPSRPADSIGTTTNFWFGALASAWARRSRASASRKAASLRPSAWRMADCLEPSARRMAPCFSPSAWVTTASRRWLISSRLDSTSSRSIAPITVRALVRQRLVMPAWRLATSYAAFAASTTW